MREIIRERLIEERDILLFDILEELKKITKPKEIETKKFNCKYCGQQHEFSWQIAQCGKKNKKKEG